VCCRVSNGASWLGRDTVMGMDERVYGHTKAGEPINDEMIERFADEAEQGYDAGQLAARRHGLGRPSRAEEVFAADKSLEQLRANPDFLAGLSGPAPAAPPRMRLRRRRYHPGRPRRDSDNTL
jgi:hypothetical protein